MALTRGPISTTSDAVIVEYGSFLLAEFPEESRSWLPALEDHRTVPAGGGCVYFLSGSTDHYPAVTIQVFSHEPPAPPGDWERVEGDVATFARATLRLYSVTSQLGQHEIALPSTGHWHVRGASAGRETIRRLGEASFAEGVERWLIALWPA